MLREKLGIEQLAQQIRDLQSLARGQIVGSNPTLIQNGQPAQPRDWKTAIVELGRSITDAVGKIASTPSTGDTGQIMMQRLLQRDELMNQYLYKLIFGEMPARHVNIERK